MGLQSSWEVLLQDMGQEDDEREVAEVEMLLGAYYMNLDSIWNKLTDISEFVDDAEVGTLLCVLLPFLSWNPKNASLRVSHLGMSSKRILPCRS